LVLELNWFKLLLLFWLKLDILDGLHNLL
jgi:hypothetical protein